MKGLKAMKSSPLLGPFGDSEFWGFSVENIDRLGVMMFQTSDNSQLLVSAADYCLKFDTS